MTSDSNSPRSAIESARRTIAIERQAVEQLEHRIDDSFSKAVDLLASVDGRVIVSGMGKSGHIGNKIAATLASTGTPAQFVHPAEACHGDMGMVTRSDAALLMSNSGTTSEITALLPLLKRLGIPIVAMTGNASSTLATAADVHLNIGVSEEACPLDLAPTASTTASAAAINQEPYFRHSEAARSWRSSSSTSSNISATFPLRLLVYQIRKIALQRLLNIA